MAIRFCSGVSFGGDGGVISIVFVSSEAIGFCKFVAVGSGDVTMVISGDSGDVTMVISEDSGDGITTISGDSGDVTMVISGDSGDGITTISGDFPDRRVSVVPIATIKVAAIALLKTVSDSF